MLNLRVTIDSRSGFCFGVVKAINRAEESLAPGRPVYSLGSIVHNEEEVARLKTSGLIPIKHADLEQIHGSKILIRAHGEAPETYGLLKKNNNEIIDATCPIVLKIQERVKRSAEAGEFVLLFGKPDHPEVIGLAGQAHGRVLVFANFEDLDLAALPRKITLFSQTTMPLESFYSVRDQLIESGFDVAVQDTVCRHVSGRKTELREFSRNHDAIVFIAGSESSNGKVLFAICAEANIRSHKVSSTDQIDPRWFNPGESVGICGATSTPQWQMEEAARKIGMM